MPQIVGKVENPWTDGLETCSRFSCLVPSACWNKPQHAHDPELEYNTEKCTKKDEICDPQKNTPEVNLTSERHWTSDGISIFVENEKSLKFDVGVTSRSDIGLKTNVKCTWRVPTFA